MKLNLHFYWIRWLVIGLISAAGFVTGYKLQDIVPVLVALFAVVFLSATLTTASQHPHKGFLGLSVFATLLLMLVVGVLNYFVNPSGLYPSRLFEPIVLTTRNYKMNLYAAYSSPPQAVILGSSRSFTVNPNQIQQLWHYSTFNASLTGGDMRDYVAFLRYIAQSRKLPQLLIVNLAPELFTPNDLRALEPDARLWDYFDNHDPLYYLKSNFDRYARLFSKEQLDLSLQLLRAEAVGRPPDYYYFDANGMGHFNAKSLSAEDLNPEKLAETDWAKLFLQNNISLYTFTSLQQILDMAKQYNMLVIGYMPPYHPVFRDVLQKQTGYSLILNTITTQLDIYEKEYSFHYINFMDSQLFSNSDEMFYDVVHPTVQASSLMMQQLYDQFHSYSTPQ